MSTPRNSPNRAFRIGGYLAILLGAFGLLAGVVGAATLIPFRDASTFDPSRAELLTVVAAVGAATSAVGVIAGWALVRSRRWGWEGSVGALGACVAVNVVMVALWGEYLPFAVIVAIVYGLLALVLWVGLPSTRLRSQAVRTP